MLNTEPESQVIVHIALAVIVKDDRVLISKRAAHVHQGGLWEFPGGKVEAGENGAQALLREIKEELGITINKTRPFINITHHYTDKSVFLETQLISQFDGENYESNADQTGLEGQAVKWVKRSELHNYQFPAANKAIITALSLPDCYLITPDQTEHSSISQFLKEFSEACQSYKLIQLRIKSLEQEQLDIVVSQCSAIAQKNQVCLMLNSSMKYNSPLKHGIHLTSRDLYSKNILACYPDTFIAASCHSLKDIERANELKLDFVVVSPVKQTTSHPDQEPMGWGKFEKLIAAAKIPVYALGGMQVTDVERVQSYGAQGISAITRLWCNKRENIK